MSRLIEFITTESILELGKHHFEPATQTNFSVAENETFKHNVAATFPKSKLCSSKIKIEYSTN